MKPRFKKIANLIGSTIKDFVRGAAKSLPGPNAILEGIENVKANREKNKINAENITEAIETTNTTKPHSWVSILTQAAFVSVFVYMFYTKKITADDLQKFVELITGIF